MSANLIHRASGLTYGRVDQELWLYLGCSVGSHPSHGIGACPWSFVPMKSNLGTETSGESFSLFLSVFVNSVSNDDAKGG